MKLDSGRGLVSSAAVRDRIRTGLPGYTITGSAHNIGEFIFFEGQREKDQKNVFIKIPASDYPSSTLIHRLEHEYAVASGLDSEFILSPRDLKWHAGNAALAFESGTCSPLSSFLVSPMKTERFLKLAIGAAEALAWVHQQGLVHKNIRPESLFITSSNCIMISDFGIASRLPREKPILGPLESIEGTYPYMAPEQTGRMNRSIDSRSDLYSLGITFYEMLTGVLPFTASDSVEWVHCHIAREAIPPTDRCPEIPRQLSAIVLKLLSKDAEERYQTASGLKLDLQRCLEQWKALSRIELFPLGTQDVPDRLLIPEKLYGREAEIELLLSAFRRVVESGRLEFVLVSGYSGIGKSSIVNELHRVLVPTRGFFASGKFDQYKRDIPYSTVVQALQSLVFGILAQSEAEITQWRSTLRDAVEGNGKLIVELIPEVELILGKQPPLPELPPQEAKNRFQRVLHRFLSVFAKQEHPLVLFLDDLQWLDAATLALLELLATEEERQAMLLIGAYRDNEVGSNHPLRRTLDTIRKAGTPIQEIFLAPLTLSDLSQLLSDSLYTARAQALPLAQLLKQKTQGNPFFALQFLRSLVEEGDLRFEASQGAWHWDLKRIQAKNYTENVVNLMIGKLKRLDARTQEALKQLACLGNSAELPTLSAAYGLSEETLSPALWEATRAGWVDHSEGTFRFLHDRIQEAAYALIPESERPALHLQAGRKLLEKYIKQGKISERIFDLVDQLNRGVSLITEPKEKERLVNLNLTAGARAKSSIAYHAACRYLRQALQLLPEDPWAGRHYETSFAVMLALAECEFLVGHFEEAESLFSELFRKARSAIDSSKVSSLQVQVYQVAGRTLEAVQVALDGLKLFGVTFPETDSEIEKATHEELRQVSLALGQRRIADLVDLPVAQTPEDRAIISLFATAAPPAYGAKPLLSSLIYAKAIRFFLSHGNTKDSCLIYVGYGAILISRFGDVSSGYAFSEVAVRLTDKFQSAILKANVLQVHAAIVSIWKEPLSRSVSLNEQSFNICVQAGNLVFAGFCHICIAWTKWERGDRLDWVLEALMQGILFAKQNHHEALYNILESEQRLVYRLEGVGESNLKYAPALNSFGRSENLATLQTAYLQAFGISSTMGLVHGFLFEQYEEALRFASEVEKPRSAILGLIFEVTYTFFYALTLAALYRQAEFEKQKQYSQEFHRLKKRIEKWATHCPKTFACRAELLAAEAARIEGRSLEETIQHYEKAIRLAQDDGALHIEAIANELSARYFARRGSETIVRAFLREARYCYSRWGAEGKVRQLDERHPELRTPSYEDLRGLAWRATRPEQLDLISIIKAQHAISSETAILPLEETLLRIVMENAGAQKGYLFVEPGSELLAWVRSGAGGSGIEFSRGPSSTDLNQVSASITSYVKRTHKMVCLGDAGVDAGEFSSDEYFARFKPKSVLCMPILRQMKLMGILYLENYLTSEAFTSSRRSILEMLSAQAAISLEVAQLLYTEKFARDALARSESRFRRIFDSNIIGIVFASGDSVIEGNDSFLEIVGYTREELRAGRVRWTDLTPPEYVHLDQIALQELATRGTCTPYEKEYFRKDGSRVPIFLAAAYLEGSQSETVAFILDISTRKQAEKERDRLLLQEREAREQTEKALRDREEFMAIAAHELRTPLTPLRLQLHILRKQFIQGTLPQHSKLRKKFIQLFSSADQQVDRLCRLVEDILDTSRINAGKLSLRFEETNLSLLVQSVVDCHQSELMRAGCVVELRVEKNITGQWDSLRIEQVITNLLTNAIKYGKGKPIEIQLSKGKDCALLQIRDHGLGIAQKDQERIFERFERAVPIQNFGGFGLGLYISRQIVRAHGGQIWVQSRPGEGATFTVEIPLQSVHPNNLDTLF